MTNPNLRYRQLLNDEFSRRYGSNPRYSLRAFARDAGVSPSRLSLILAGRQGLSREVAQKIARRLGWKDRQGLYFSILVEAAHARGEARRQVAELRLRDFEVPVQLQQINADTIECLSHWYYGAILELMQLPIYQKQASPTEPWIAEQFDLSEHVVVIALERLARLGLLEPSEGRWRCTHAHLSSSTDVPSSAIKGFHSQILEKANAALQNRTVEQREIYNAIIGIDRSQFLTLRQRLRELKASFLKEAQAPETKDAVYCFGLNFFELTEQRKNQ